MKQGKANPDGRTGWKREPKSNAVSPAGVSQIGSSLGNHVTDDGRPLRNLAVNMYEGRGYAAPMKSIRTRRGGSQGSY